MGQWIDGKFVLGQRDYDGYNIIDFKESHIFKQHVPYAPLPKGQEYPEATNRLAFDGKTFKWPKAINTGIGQSSIFFTDGDVYTVVIGGKPQAMQLTSFIDGEWLPQAELDTDSQGVILPLRNGTFLVGIREGHLVGDNKHDANPFGIYKRNTKGKLEFIEIIDIKSAVEGIKIMHIPEIQNIAITGDHYTFIDADMGALWSFSKSTGRLIRSKVLYPEVIEALKSNKWVVPVIICAQPTNDGEILISAWSGKLCLEGGSIATIIDEIGRERYRKTNNLTSDEIFEKINQLHDSICALDPVIRWYNYDPVSGSLKRERTSPKGANNFISSRDEYIEYRKWCLNSERELFYIDSNKLIFLHPEKKVDLSKIAKQFLTDN
jgi:hypothetical protein